MKEYVDTQYHEDEGFKILIQYQSWRTAMLNSCKENTLSALSYVEKHTATDEVFVLLKGQAYLIVGGDAEKPDFYEIMPMDLYKSYNVKKNVWHASVLSKNASIYIVENIETGKENSDYYYFEATEKDKIIAQIPKLE
jgi:ureidoglycolate hydrolase